MYSATSNLSSPSQQQPSKFANLLLRSRPTDLASSCKVHISQKVSLSVRTCPRKFALAGKANKIQSYTQRRGCFPLCITLPHAMQSKITSRSERIKDTKCGWQKLMATIKVSSLRWIKCWFTTDKHISSPYLALYHYWDDNTSSISSY